MLQSFTSGPAPTAPSFPPVVFEREPGAATAPVPRSYQRHEPEKTALYAAVAGNIETFLDAAKQQSTSGAGCPKFIEREFKRYLGCGILANGFARLRCPDCGFERLVAFSCKGRICPSCWARRLGDTAAHLVDRVLPKADYRQWVLTFPRELRLSLAMNRGLLSDMLGVFLGTLSKWQRRRGRALGIRGETGAVTFIPTGAAVDRQRFGGEVTPYQPSTTIRLAAGRSIQTRIFTASCPTDFLFRRPKTVLFLFRSRRRVMRTRDKGYAVRDTGYAGHKGNGGTG